MKYFIRAFSAVLSVIIVIVSLPLTSLAVEIPTSPKNGIPLVIVRIDESEEAIAAATENDSSHTYGTVEDMNSSYDHSVRCTGTIEFIVPDEYKGEYGSVNVPDTEVQLSYIRGRGNTTWSPDPTSKNPYKIQLKNATDLFGMGESKEWALMSNDSDYLLLKNRITSWLGGEMGLAYTPQMVPVEVVMIGSKSGSRYLGAYDLSELVDVEESRVNIPKLKKSVTEAPDITGGYLLSIYTEYQDSDESENNHFKTDVSGLEFLNQSPDFEKLEDGRPAQQSYIRDFVNELDALIMKEGKIDEMRHNRIADMLDLKSVADYWLIQEFSSNGDAFGTHSTYFYKERNGKFCFGPLWDFDIAWDGSVKPEFITFNESVMPWTDKLREDDPLFAEYLKERWSVLDEKLGELVADGGKLDEFKDEIKSAYITNQQLRNETYDNIDFANDDIDELVVKFKNRVNSRKAVFNEKIDEINKVHFTVTYEANGETVDTQTVRGESVLDKGQKLPNNGDNYFIKWVEKETGEDHESFVVRKDTTFVAVYKKLSDMVAPESLYFRIYEVTEMMPVREYRMDDVIVLPEEAADDALAVGVWSISDESVAEVDNTGLVTFKKPGVVTVTFTLYNGLSKSYQLHIYDPLKETPVTPRAMTVPKTITLAPGEKTQIVPEFEYAGELHKPLFPSFDSNDYNIVDVDYTGVVVALSTGKTTIEVTAENFFEDDVEPLVGKVEIIVKDSAAPVKPVKLAAPKITAKAMKNKKALISFKKIKGAKYYKVFYRKAGAKKWKVKKVTTNKAVIKNLKSGAMYQFRVAAYDGNGNRGKYSSVKRIYIKSVKGIKVNAKKKAAKISWKKVKGASGYQILVSTNKNMKNARIINVKGAKRTSYTVKKLKKGKKYYITVRPYKTKGNKKHLGFYSAKKAVKI